MHVFQELIEYQCGEGASPARFWTYADEAWGGYLAKAGSRRGGAKFAHTTAANLISRFRALSTLDPLS